MVLWSKLRSWFQRHRRFALLLSALFIIFEASRALSVGQLLLPNWGEDVNAEIAAMFSHPPLITATIAVLSVSFFAVPMAAVIYATLKVRRSMSRYWTALKRRG